MNKPTLDDIMNGRVQTRDGRSVKIYAYDPKLNQPVIGNIDEDRGVDQWSEDGSFRDYGNRESDYDLVLKPEFVKVGATIDYICDSIIQQADLIHMNAPVLGFSKIEIYIDNIKNHAEQIKKINGATNHDAK